jgi:alpha-L-fucosidase
VDGACQELARGTTVGYRKLDRLSAAPVRRVRVTVEDAVVPPSRLRIGVYGGGPTAARSPA